MSTATLTAPTPALGTCGVASANFAITLDAALAVDAVFNIASTVGGDTITSNPVTIAAGLTAATFTVTPLTCASRTISITTSTQGVTIGTGSVTYTSTCGTTNCPDDSGATAQTANFASLNPCLPSAITNYFVPSTQPQKDLYQRTSIVNVVITP